MYLSGGYYCDILPGMPYKRKRIRLVKPDGFINIGKKQQFQREKKY
jgi:hypothetical protein